MDAKSIEIPDYRILFENAPSLFLILKPEPPFIILEASDIFLLATKTVRENIVGKSVFDVFPEDPKNEHSANSVNILRNSLTRVVEKKIADVMPIVRYDIRKPECEGGGFEERYWTTTNSPILKDGKLLYIFNQAGDVTEAMRLQNLGKPELESYEAYKLAFENAPLGIAKVALNGRFLQVNASFCNIVGRTSEELKLIDFQTITHPADLEQDNENVRKCLSGEIQSYCMEKRYIRKTGESIWVRLDVTLLRDSKELPFQFIAHATDISDSKAIKDELINTLEHLRKNNDDLEQFAYVASHDLQEPLRTVNSYVQLFAVKYKDLVDDKGKQYIQFITDATTRLRELIRSLLDYSRSGQTTVKQKASFHEVLDEALSGLQTKISVNKAKIIYDKWHDTPINGNILEISRVFQNLISNSIKFARPNHRPTIKIGYEKKEGFTVFFVKDNGIGIAEANLSKLFEMFYRAKDGAVNAEGTGIGLAICKRIIEKHGGTITVESVHGQGSKFYFTLPD
jgi:PAS domain S-box-containing protein